MSLAYEDYVQLFCVRCGDVGLDCNCIINGIDEEKVIDNTIIHMLEYHAIKPEEMTMCMRLKIKESMHIQPLSPTGSQLAYKNHFG
ncbi:MAG: DUF1059 domain-containing protein [Nitrososphaeraceae archaeon]|nr:DUF1059 domain-containing protein [Nitrososphaeraceae archaeon]